MSGLRRFGALLAVLGVALAALIVRLYEVQVGEHEVWAREALGLVRESAVIPARRGAIVDRRGRVLVEDEEDYVLDFVWRDFRREQPLGAVAQACSQLLGRPVPLHEADAHLLEWALALVSLSPDDLEAFARGEALPALGLPEEIPALASDPEEARELARASWRRTRAGDARFYIESLLGTTSRETYDLRQRDSDLWDGRSFLERTAAVRESLATLARDEAEVALLHEWSDGLLAAREHLAGFAEALSQGPAPYAALLDRLEGIRVDVEDAVADSLFLSASGFAAPRLSSANLERLDLEWLRVALVWDPARLEAWRERRGAREQGPEGLGGPGSSWVAARVYARLQLAREEAGATGLAPSDRVVLELLRPFAPGDGLTDWRSLESPAPLASLAAALEEGLGGEADPLLLPTQRPAALGSRAAAGGDSGARGWTAGGDSGARGWTAGGDSGARGWTADHAHLERVLALGCGPREPGAVGELLALATRSREEWDDGELAPIELVLGRLDRRIQAEVARRLDERPTGGAASFSAQRLTQALEPRDHLLKDQSLRPRRLLDRPAYPLIEAITRYPAEHAGFVVRPRHTRRWRAFDRGLVRSQGVDLVDEPRPLLAGLVGALRSPSLLRVLRERDDLERARAIEAGLDRNLEGFEELARIHGSAVHAQEKVGGSGLEAHFDIELRGRHGFRESIGLTERGEAGFSGEVPPLDGPDLRLTLDLDLQRAALEVLERPEPPRLPSGALDPKADPDWWRDPVGALVLARVDGEVLAAASVPTREVEEGSFAGADRRDGERLLGGLDRTLRMRGFQPPGSTLKPLVALWGLDRGWLDDGGRRQALTARTPVVACLKDHAHPSGWGQVACNSYWGHSSRLHGQAAGGPRVPDITLQEALPHSCNAYFAWLGAHLSPDDHRALAATFGLGQPTGARRRPREEERPSGAGLVEDARNRGFLVELGEHGRQLAGNGLGVLQVTPMQLARAYAGLATGSLPEMRLVLEAGGEELPPRAMPLPFAAEHLATVRSLLRRVVTEGSASGARLGEQDLGFRFACKTGSADITGAEGGWVPDGEGGWKRGVRKHTWVAGWFPAEAPEFVVVLLVHDTSATSGSGAVHVMSQFLRREEVRALAR
ncbi:MAG: hypothetical protein ISQ08_00095 [Planctomycetes bacterium]|nr:hypothetical protein [Planctomycetota bacterium]